MQIVVRFGFVYYATITACAITLFKYAKMFKHKLEYSAWDLCHLHRRITAETH